MEIEYKLLYLHKEREHITKLLDNTIVYESVLFNMYVTKMKFINNQINLQMDSIKQFEEITGQFLDKERKQLECWHDQENDSYNKQLNELDDKIELYNMIIKTINDNILDHKNQLVKITQRIFV